jgi:adenylate cyclase
MCRILDGLSVHHYVRAEYRQARELAEAAFNLAQQTVDPMLVALTHWYLGFVLFASGEYKTAHLHLAHMIASYEPQQHHNFIILRGSDAGMSALSYDACCLWCLGFPDQAMKRSLEALVLGRKFDHPFSSADVFAYAGCMFNILRRNREALKENAEELLRLTLEKDFQGFLGTATCHRGIALILLGQFQEGIEQILEGLALRHSTGVRLEDSGVLCFLAEARAKTVSPEEGLATLDEAFAMVEKTEERQWEAELHRLKGELLLERGNQSEAEVSLCKAIEVARAQSAKSWELRAVMSLGRLLQRQGKKAQAKKMLAEVYNWFTEGFDTPELIEARGLLEELS